jgi:hypothetical protein
MKLFACLEFNSHMSEQDVCWEKGETRRDDVLFLLDWINAALDYALGGKGNVLSKHSALISSAGDNQLIAFNTQSARRKTLQSVTREIIRFIKRACWRMKPYQYRDREIVNINKFNFQS